jgi:uncharacterized protein YkuJ
MLEKVISGGQTGADRGGLIAAKLAGIETGGCMPKGFRALDGHHPNFAQLYGVTEHTSSSYPPRTYRNAFDSDGTVRIAVNFSSAGEICTLNAVQKAGKMSFDVDVLGSTTPAQLADWIRENTIRILNVAGNSEKTAPGIEEFTVAFLLETFAILTHNRTTGTAVNDNC